MSLLIKGVTEFLGLTDTPAAYAGKTTQLPRVKATEDGLEFAPGGKFTATKLFDGASASPPTIYTSPLTMLPNAIDSAGNCLGGFAAIVVDDWLYAFGGKYGGTAIYEKRCYRYHLTGHYWERVSDLPVHVGFVSTEAQRHVCYHDSKIWVPIAYKYLPTGDYFKILSYTIATDTWTVEADYPAGDHWSLECIFACSDFLYLHQWNGGADRRFDRMDYTTKVWTSKTAIGAGPRVSGKISDEIYGAITTDDTYKYDKAGDSWVAQSQPMPAGYYGATFDETGAAIWAIGVGGSPPYHAYRYTPAGGWVQQYQQARDCDYWSHALVSTKTGAVYFLWDGTPTGTEPVVGGSIHTYEDWGVWKLLSQAFNAGDLLILYEQAGIPVVVEKNGVLLFVGSGLDTVYMVQTGTYLFSLSKDFEMTSVQIWRSVWG